MAAQGQEPQWLQRRRAAAQQQAPAAQQQAPAAQQQAQNRIPYDALRQNPAAARQAANAAAVAAVARLADRTIPISNQIRLERFREYIGNYHHRVDNSLLPEASRITYINRLEQLVNGDPIIFGTELNNIYRDLWINYNHPTYINRQGVEKAGIRITDGRNIIRVSSYGSTSKYIPKGQISLNALNEEENTLNAAKRELKEETGIDIDTHQGLQGVEGIHTLEEIAGDMVNVYTYNVSPETYIALSQFMRDHAEEPPANAPHRSADVTTIYYKKYMKYKAKYLALVKSMGK